MTERVARACGIAGWMTVAELEWLEQQASGQSMVIELGSWKGRSSVALSAAGLLICVDTFVDQAQEGGTGDDLMPAFSEAVRPYSSGVIPIRGDIGDEEFSEWLIAEYGGRAGLVFIDASHDEASVRRDIKLATRLAGDEAIICGHDFSPAWPGVMNAVASLMPGFERAADSIWWRAK